MRGAGILLLGLLGGCFTQALWSGSSAPPPQPKLVGEADCTLELTTPVAGSRSLSFAVGAPKPRAPERMGIEMRRGQTRLHLRRPFALAFAGTDLLQGRTFFPPGHVTVNFAQIRTPDGTRRDPALLRIEGILPPGLEGRIEPCAEPAVRRPLDEIGEAELRVQLGRGIDTLVSSAVEMRPTDVVAWHSVEGPGDWRSALAEAHRTGSLAPLEPYRVVASLWRGGSTQCYRLRLGDAVLASNLRLGQRRYTWEGLWIGSLDLPEETAASSSGIPARLRYTEYKQKGKSVAGVAWRVLLTPVALAGDYGIAAIDSWIESQGESERVTRP